MKNLITYLKTLWSWGANSQSKDVSHDCRFTVGSPSGMTAKLQVNSFMRFAVVLTLIFSIGVGNVWGAVESGTTYDTKSISSLPTGWRGSDGSGSDYVKLIAKTHYIQTDAFCQNGFTSIKIKARKFGGPSAAQALITVSWYDSSTSDETVLGTVAPTKTSLTDYTINSPANPTANTEGYIKIACKGASASKGSGVSQVTITYTAGSCGGGSTPSVTPDPTSLDWGSVLQSSSQSTKTFDISGSNLTGNLSVAVTGGYSVSCGSSISVTSGTPNVTKITVTPPSTSTTGAKNGKVTISGGGLASNVEVNLSMTVNAAYAVHYYVNGSEITGLKELVASGGKVSSLPNAESCDAVNYPYFVGWSTTNFGSTTSAPSLVTGNETISSETTYYAVFAAGTGGNSSTSTIDFEGKSSTYSDWTFKNLNSQQTGTITAKGGTYYGTTGGATASVTTINKIASPTSLTAYVSKQTTNTTSSTWYIRVSSDGSTWTDVKSQSAISMSKGTWVEMTADLTAYSDVYVQVYYDGSTAVRNIDNLTLSSGTPPTYTEWITKCCESWTPPTLSYSVPGNWKAGDSDVNATLGSGTTHGSATWTSSDESVLTVNNSGQIHAVGAGTATVTVTWAGDATHCSQSRTSATITVTGSVAVSFNANGGSLGITSQSVPYSTATNLTTFANLSGKALNCKRFDHWNTANDNSGTSYTDGQSVTLTAGLTLYAIYSDITYAVSDGTMVGVGSHSYSANPITCGTTLTITCAADASHKGNPTVTATGTHGDITVVSATSVTIANVTSDITVSISYAAKEVYTVTWNVNGNASVTSSVTSGNKPTFPSTPASCDDASTTFVGWSTAPWSGKIANLTGKTVYTSADDMPAVEGPVTYYAVWANGGGGGSDEWVETDLADLTSSDVFVFSDGEYAVSTANGDAVDPPAVPIIVINHKITSTVTDAMKWNVSGNSTVGYTFFANGTSNKLYCNTEAVTKSNDNLKIGAGGSYGRYVWKPDNNGYLVSEYENNGQSANRWISRNGTSNWRSYRNTSTNPMLPVCFKHIVGGGNTDYVTTCCSEVEEPSVTVEHHATYAVLTWPHQTNAVSYTATCSGGSVGSITGGDTRSCTITGLTENTAYTYTVTAAGSSCSQTAAGGFTTAACDDVPVISSAVATTTTITFNWTCTSNNSTIYIYSDENYLREVRRKATTHATTAKTDTVAGLESRVTYYYKILSDNTCASEGGSVATLESKITIAEWDTCGVYLDLGDIQGAIAIVENQNTQATVQQKYAKGLFFSKYFEAYQNVKLWAVYNGTENKISLADVKVLVGSNGNAWGYSGKDPNATAAKTELSGYGHTETGWIYPGEEIIVYNEGSTATDGSIMACAENENANFDDWYLKKNNTTAFSGDDGLILIQGTDTIDVIGGMNIATAYTKTVKKSWNDDKGWWCENGQDMDGNSIELSTNRCLLVRKNTVEDGLNAVALNKDSFNTLCSEWVGTQVATGGNEINASCLGFTYVGNYDYNAYYAKYDTIQKNIELDDIRQDDGTYFIKISQLDTMSCTNLRIVVTTTEGEKLTGSWKIPIFVTNDKATVQTSDEVFTKEGEDCATCDVVVLRKANLQVVDGGKNTIRNIEVYPTATLDVPTGKTYNINSIIMRSKDDAVSRANVIGTLTPTIKNVYLDKRITATRVYKFSLPYACNIADVTWRSGEKAVYGTDWILRWYDGDRRANGTQNGNWKLFTGSIIQPGVGYDLVINSDVLEPKNKYAELRFPMAIGGDNVTSPAEVSVPVKAYGANNSRTKDGQPVTPNHLGWNLIGNPYLNDYTKNHMPNDLTEGALSIVDDKYTLTKDGLRYLVVPTYAGSTTYQQVNMAITDMEPFTAYFVQIDGTTDNQELNVVFSLSNVAGRSAVRSRLPVQEYEEDNHIVWYAIDMSNNGGKKDETTLLISNRFNDKFEMMDDMHKIRNAGQSIIATRNDDGEMVFNALPDSSAAVKGVPVHYYAAEAGDYTISTSANYSLEEVAEAWLFDKTTGQYTNLLTDNYHFATAAGNNTDRFTLFVRVERKKAPEVATGNDNILTDGQLSLTAIDRTLVLSGLTENADVYVYDMSGKLLRGERANGNGIWRANVPAQGVYFVRVNSAGGQQTLRTIVK